MPSARRNVQPSQRDSRLGRSLGPRPWTPIVVESTQSIHTARSFRLTRALKIWIPARQLCILRCRRIAPFQS
jgi:hypothetical protein